MKVSYRSLYFLYWLFLYDFVEFIHTYSLWCFIFNLWFAYLKKINLVFKCTVAKFHPFSFSFVFSGVCNYRFKLRKSVRIRVSKVNPFILLLESVLPSKREISCFGLPIDLDIIGRIINIGTCSVPC